MERCARRPVGPSARRPEHEPWRLRSVRRAEQERNGQLDEAVGVGRGHGPSLARKGPSDKRYTQPPRSNPMRPEDIDDEAERRIDEAAARFLVEHRERSERERKERLTRYFRTAYETATTDGSRNGIRRAAKDFGIVLKPD